MFVDQRWVDVPEGQIQYRALPGDIGETYGEHWCGSTHDEDTSTLNTLYMTKCVRPYV